MSVLVHEIVGGAGIPTEIVVGPEGSLSQVPIEHVAVRIRVVDGLTRTLAPVAPVDHRTKPSQPIAETRTVSPAQTVAVVQSSFGADGLATTLTVIAFDAPLTHAVETRHTAVYVVVFTGETVMEVVVKPLDQTTVPAQLVAVKVT